MDGVELYPEAAKMPLFWATLAAEEKIVVNQGGTSSGKSHAIIRILFFLAIMFRNIKIEVVGASIPKLVGDTLEIASDLAHDNQIIKRNISHYNATNRTFFLKNRSKIIFNSYETAKDADGPKRDILYLSEARNIMWACCEQLIKRTKRKVYIDYNPVEEFWCHDKIINCQPGPNGKLEYPSVKVIRSWHIHNEFISQSMHDDIENIADKELWKAYARGLTAKLTGMCYPGWTVIEEFPLCDEVVWGYDIGFTNDPSVIVKVGIKPYKMVQNAAGIMVKEYLKLDYVFEELCYAPGIASGELARLLYLYGYKFGQPVYMDHNNTIQRELRSLRIVAVKAEKGKGCIPARVIHLRSRRCAYTKASENIHAERRRYMFATDREGKVLNVPKEGFDHAMNACEYGAFTHAIRKGLIKGWAKDSQNAE